MRPLDDGQDGVIRLRRRETSRLWFRMADPSNPTATVPARPLPQAVAKSTENPGTDKLVSEMVRVVRSTGPLRSAVADTAVVASALAPAATHAQVAPAPTEAAPVVTPISAAVATAPASSPSSTATSSPASPPASSPADDVEWRAVQAGAPVLLLSSGPVLECSKPGPILGPGMRYRITSMTGSVVGMEVMHANGDTRSGYANAVDLRCMEPKIVTGELSTEKGLTGRLRLSKLATTTFGLFGG